MQRQPRFSVLGFRKLTRIAWKEFTISAFFWPTTFWQSDRSEFRSVHLLQAASGRRVPCAAGSARPRSQAMLLPMPARIPYSYNAMCEVQCRCEHEAISRPDQENMHHLLHFPQPQLSVCNAPRPAYHYLHVARVCLRRSVVTKSHYNRAPGEYQEIMGSASSGSPAHSSIPAAQDHESFEGPKELRFRPPRPLCPAYSEEPTSNKACFMERPRPPPFHHVVLFWEYGGQNAHCSKCINKPATRNKGISNNAYLPFKKSHRNAGRKASQCTLVVLM